MTTAMTFDAHRNALDWIAGALVIIGALNWGLVGVEGVNLVGAIFGDGSLAAQIVYVLVGLSGIYCLVRAFVPHRDTVLDNRHQHL
jgi:uncharacterized protein